MQIGENQGRGVETGNLRSGRRGDPVDGPTGAVALFGGAREIQDLGAAVDEACNQVSVSA